jgi:hypothetical protein
VSKLGIPYKNRGPVALCVNGAMITAMDGIKSLPEVEMVETKVARACEGELGG